MTITKNSSYKNNLLNFYNSSLGKKIITGVTGLGLTFFVLFHAIANLTIISDRESYNQLAHWLEGFGFIFYGVELLLFLTIIFHLVVGISIRIKSQRSRPQAYYRFQSAGFPSKQSLSSISMAITGILIVGFLVWHLWSFKFGAYYSTTINGVVMRDLSKLVIEKFHHPLYAFGYVGAISFLGIHLRHGIWSAGQSLGLLDGNSSHLIYRFSSILAIVITFSFIALPLTVYFGFLD